MSRSPRFPFKSPEKEFKTQLERKVNLFSLGAWMGVEMSGVIFSMPLTLSNYIHLCKTRSFRNTRMGESLNLFSFLFSWV